MYKCIRSHCIPLRFVCNLRWDCIGGEDESFCGGFNCSYHMHCKYERTCLHSIELCNGRVECLLSYDDEELCDVTTCPDKCRCAGHCLECIGAHLLSLPRFSTLVRAVILRGNTFHKWRRLYLTMQLYLFRLDISNNQIMEIEARSFRNCKSLQELFMLDNHIVSLSKGLFWSLSNLVILNLQSNSIKALQYKTFSGALKLKYIFCSAINLNQVADKAFGDLVFLENLDLSQNAINTINKDTFKRLDHLKNLSFPLLSKS